MTLQLPFVVLPHGEGLDLPSYATSESAVLDLRAAFRQETTLLPGQRQLIPTGLQVQLPAGYEGQIRPRSGLALKNGITVLNTPGTIDSDYRGEVQIILINLGDAPFTIERGMRIAQMVVSSVTRCLPVIEMSLEQSSRQSGGFGSTGVA